MNRPQNHATQQSSICPESERQKRHPPFAYNDFVGSRTGRPLSASSGAGRGKSELRRAVCRITSGRAPAPVWTESLDGKCHRKYTASAFTGRGKGEKVR